MRDSQCPEGEFVEEGMPDMRDKLPEGLRAPRTEIPVEFPETFAFEHGAGMSRDAQVRTRLDPKKAEIHAERGNSFGDGTEGHTNLGLEWTGIIQNHYKMRLPYPIPPDVVLLMMAASKINRAACPTPIRDDNYDDGAIYIEMAREAKGGERSRCIHNGMEERKGLLHTGDAAHARGPERNAGEVDAGRDGSSGGGGSAA